MRTSAAPGRRRTTRKPLGTPRVPHSTHPGFHIAPTPGAVQPPLEQNPPEQHPLEQNPPEPPSLRSGILSVPKSPSVLSRNARETDGAEKSPTDNTTDKPWRGVAEQLLSDERLQHDLTRIDLLPATKRHQQAQYTQLVKAIDSSLLRFPPEKVEWYLRDKARTARTVSWLITAFTNYSDAIADVPMPDQDQDEAAADARLEQSLLDAAPATPTSAPVAAGDAKATTRAPSGPVEPYQDATSPVEDLPDELYAALSPAEKATVHAHAGTSWESLPSIAARQLRAIYDRVSAAA